MKYLGLSLFAAFALAQGIRAADSSWLTDLPKAQAAAKEKSKLVLLDFTGSDWCPPCKQLHKNVLTSKEFIEFAKDSLVLVELDFPQGTKQPVDLQKANEALAQKFNIEGFPTIIVLDGDGKQLSKQTGYEGESAKEFVAKLQKLKPKS